MLNAHQNKFLANAGGVFLSRMTMPVASFVVLIAMTQALSPAQLGHFSIVMGLYALFQFISVLGYDNLVIRDVAKNPACASDLIGNGLLLGAAASFICALVMVILGYLFHYPPDVIKSIYLAVLILFPAFINSLAEAVFVGLKKSLVAFYGAALREGFWVVFSLWGLWVFKNVDTVIWAFFASRMLAAGAFFYLFKREKVAIAKKFNHVHLKSLVRVMPVFIGINVLSNIFFESDIIILSMFVTMADVGYYSVAKKVVRVGVIVFFSIITALFPLISEIMQGPRERWNGYFKKSSLKILAVVLLIVLPLYSFAGFIVKIFFGEKFFASIMILQIILWKMIPLSLSFLWSRFLISGDRQNRDLIAVSVGLVVFLCLGILGTKFLGTKGMAMADVTAVSILALLHLYFTLGLLRSPDAVLKRGKG